MVVCLLLALMGRGALPGAAQPTDSTLGLAEVVRTTLAEHPRLQQQRAAVARRKGKLTTARGAFDTQMSLQVNRARDRTPLTPLQQRQYTGVSEQVTNTYSTQLSLQRNFRTGLVVQPEVTLRRTALGAVGDSLPASLSSLPTNNTAQVGLQLTQPLLKGRGAAATKARVSASVADLKAAEADWRQAVARRVRAVVTAYWRYVSAYERRRVARTSEGRVERLLEETKTLVEANQRPAAELDQLRADRADKSATRIRAEQVLSTARIELARAMGVSARRSAVLAPPADSLPVLDEVDLPAALPPAARLQAHALDHRPDLRAARRRTEAARELLDAARRNRLHTLDLSVGLGYTGITGGETVGAYVDPLRQNVSGMNFQVGLRYELPVRNRQAEGERVRRRAVYEQQQHAETEAARHVRLDVQQAYQDVQAGRAELRKTRTAVRSHRRALDNERKKLRQGVSTLFNVLLFEERLTQALRTRIAARRRLAVAIAELRYALGAFSTSEIVDGQALLTRADVIAFPRISE